MSEETKQLKVMRAMAWQRAKGELKSMMETYYPDYESDYKLKEFSGKFEHLKDLFDHFVDEVERHELDK